MSSGRGLKKINTPCPLSRVIFFFLPHYERVLKILSRCEPRVLFLHPPWSTFFPSHLISFFVVVFSVLLSSCVVSSFIIFHVTFIWFVSLPATRSTFKNLKYEPILVKNFRIHDHIRLLSRPYTHVHMYMSTKKRYCPVHKHKQDTGKRI